MISRPSTCKECNLSDKNSALPGILDQFDTALRAGDVPAILAIMQAAMADPAIVNDPKFDKIISLFNVTINGMITAAFREAGAVVGGESEEMAQ